MRQLVSGRLDRAKSFSVKRLLDVQDCKDKASLGQHCGTEVGEIFQRRIDRLRNPAHGRPLRVQHPEVVRQLASLFELQGVEVIKRGVSIDLDEAESGKNPEQNLPLACTGTVFCVMLRTPVRTFSVSPPFKAVLLRAACGIKEHCGPVIMVSPPLRRSQACRPNRLSALMCRAVSRMRCRTEPEAMSPYGVTGKNGQRHADWCIGSRVPISQR